MSKQPSTTDPQVLGQNAERVARQHEDYERAEEIEESAYADLFDAVLEKAEPALLAISSALGPNHRGLLLIQGEGEQVVWLDDGCLAALSGTHTKPLNASAIVDHYGRGGIVDAISRISVAIDAQLRGNKHQANEKIRRRAEQIRAVATLIRGLS